MTHAGGMLVAYFCMEYGIDESLPLYAGGLGVLAGDHLKAAADLGVPLVGVGLLYRRGSFRQALDAGGRQVEEYRELDPARLPLELERSPEGRPLTLTVELDGDPVIVQVWRAQVGAVPLYLLDSNVAGNSERGLAVTDVLYGGGEEHRVEQELLVGVGGVRALHALDLEPTVFHANEGHSAFLALERARALVATGVPFREAIESVRATTVFTTHTPVPAGNEVFPGDLVGRYVQGLAAECGVSVAKVLALGRPVGPKPGFGMTELALRVSGHANAVSVRHASVARAMWAGLWPDRSVDEVPIRHVTNGVHALSWLSDELAHLLRSAGVRPEAPPAEAGWEHAAELDQAELWEVHRRRKAALLEHLRTRSPGATGLDDEALTIGFARRFTGYKRAGLLFSDLEQLDRLLLAADRPVQIVLAGKAHPADVEGKAILADVSRAGERSGGRVAFAADYDLSLAKLLVQGVDVWLNTPRRPQEASGTSGMKAGVNGVLNVSVPDGWWAEAYEPAIGWVIAPGLAAPDDAVEAADLYRLLAEEIAPTFYERDGSGVPRRWTEMMRASIAVVGRRFTAGRMLTDYVERLYVPAHQAGG